MRARRGTWWRETIIGLLAVVPQATIGASPSEEVKPAFPAEWARALQWRSIGPANMGGRITDVAVYEADPCLWWAATASGGLLKTTDNGVTFEHQFDREATVSIGDVAVAQTDANIVWVGTGESNPRNSVSWGDGVYKSSDGGKTWKNMGLRASFQVGRIQIHPQNADIVYVAALGRLWGPSEERGLFKTTDGGTTWTKVLFVDDKTGVIDVQLHPKDPETILAATWERQRDGFDGNDPATRWGPGSGLWRSSDGGATWQRITNGLPSCNLGRIGIDWYRGDGDIVYALLESEKIGKEPDNAAYIGVRAEDAEVGARLVEITDDGPAPAAGLRTGDVILRVDGEPVLSNEDLLRQVRRHLAGDTVEIELARERKSIKLELKLAERPGAKEDAPGPENEAAESGEAEGQRRRQTRSPFDIGLGGQRENAHDQQGPEGYEYGGVFRSSDGGRTWKRINSVNPRPMYFSQIRVDPGDDNHVYVLGIALYRSSDGGETFTADGASGDVHVDHHALWIDPRDGRHMVLGNDGGIYVTWDRMEHWDHLNHAAIGQFYHVTVDPRPSYMVYGGLQDNGSWGGPSRSRDGSGPINEDWISIGGGDGFVCQVDREDPDQVYFESQNGGIGRFNLRTGERGFMQPRAPRGTRYRFNWRTPFILSHHNSRVYYAAGNHVFRSLDRGKNIRAISPEITSTEQGSATALGESPLEEGVLYVGTDEGGLWMTRDGGQKWINLFDPPAEDEASEAPAAAPEGPRDGEGGERGERGGRRGGRGGPGRMLQLLERADANGDGKIERSELPERMADMFDRLDTSGDGAIDEQERKAFAERPRGAGGGEAPAAPGGEEAAAETAAAPTIEAPPAQEPAPEPPAQATEAPVDQPAAAPPPEAAPAEAPAASAAPAAPASTPAAAAAADPLTGIWTGQARSEEIPPDQGGFTLTLKLEPDGTVTGHLKSQFNDGEIVPGKYDRESRQLRFQFESEQMSLTFTATVGENKLSGRMDAAGGMFSLEFDATRTAPTTGGAPAGEAPPSDGYDWKPIKELLPAPRCVASIEPSRFKAGRVYLAIDGHRSDDQALYLFLSEDFGRRWRSIRGNLPDSAGPLRVLREDITNENILYAGTEFSAWVSIDRGATWTSLNTNLPTVAVHEFAQHPTTGEIVAATHGRSIWILDVTPLRQVTSDLVANGANLFKPGEVKYWRALPSRGGDTRRFVGSNATDGAAIFYSLKEDGGFVGLRITDASGKSVRELQAQNGPGLHRVSWDLRRERPRGEAGGQRGQGGQRGERGGGRFRRGLRVPPGEYRVVLTVNETDYTQPLTVRADPEYPDVILWGEAYEEQLELLEGPLEEPLEPEESEDR